MTACVLKAAGAPIVPCPVTVKMGHPALLTKASVSVLRDSGAPLAREVSVSGVVVPVCLPKDTMDTVGTSIAPVHNTMLWQ